MERIIVNSEDEENTMVPYVGYEYNYVEGETLFDGILYVNGGTTHKVTFVKADRSRCIRVFAKYLQIGQITGIQQCRFWTQCPTTKLHMLCYDAFQPIKTCTEPKFQKSNRVCDWLYLNHIKERPNNTIDVELTPWWKDNITRILNAIKSLHNVGVLHGNLGDEDNYVISGESINLIDVGGSERLVRADGNWPKIDLSDVRDFLDDTLPRHISCDRFYFISFFNKMTNVDFEYDIFFKKLVGHPFLLNPHTRLKYAFDLGNAMVNANFKNDPNAEFVWSLEFEPYYDWTELLVELDDLVNTGQHPTDLNVGNYEVIVAAYKYCTYANTPNELLRFLRNMQTHRVTCQNEAVVEHYVNQLNPNVRNFQRKQALHYRKIQILSWASAIFVGVYEPTKQKLLKAMPENLSALAHLVLKQLMQTAQFSSAPDAVRLILAKEGFKGLYAGYGSFLLRDLPFDAVQFCIYEQLRIGFKLAARRDLNDPEVALIGAFSGAVTGAITTPLDVIKTRLMVQGSENQYRGIYDCVRTVMREEGSHALWKGIGPRVLWIGIGGSIFFGVLERTKQILEERRRDLESNSLKRN